MLQPWKPTGILKQKLFRGGSSLYSSINTSTSYYHTSLSPESSYLIIALAPLSFSPNYFVFLPYLLFFFLLFPLSLTSRVHSRPVWIRGLLRLCCFSCWFHSEWELHHINVCPHTQIFWLAAGSEKQYLPLHTSLFGRWEAQHASSKFHEVIRETFCERWKLLLNNIKNRTK